MIQFILTNWATILVAGLPLLEVIVRLTPTERDNSIFNFVKKMADNYITNKKEGGGAH